MNRTTIDFGIDLGTTNSEIAVLSGVETRVIPNEEGAIFTPSAVWIGRNQQMYVGQKAKGRILGDPENGAFEFKRNMGTDSVYTFQASERRLTPEELSAEVLKTLRFSVMNNSREEIRSAVITVPAAFQLPQCEATQRAARLAGLEVTPLLQEPIAAALAYGFQDPSEKVFWLVYDFGGGTFDAALINMRDGMFQVVNHGGDNQLGGKDIDNRIIDDILVPAILKEKKLENFQRSNKLWGTTFAKLKIIAEEAKIQLSKRPTYPISSDELFSKMYFDFQYDLTVEEVSRLAEPLILRSIKTCKQVLNEARLGAGSVEKLILVGGPTLAPYLIEMLADPQVGLGIPLEFSIDPFTVVARGAAVFAGTQRLNHNETFAAAVPGCYQIDLEYQPVGVDDQPIIGGRVHSAEKKELAGYGLEISSPQWSSGRIPLSANGSFMTTVLADRGVRNEYALKLFDPQGTPLDVEPKSFAYTIGNATASQPLIHSMGIALANNETAWFLKKGTPLPARHREKLRTAVDVHRGSGDDVIRIPVIEGENRLADRNQQIGVLEIKSAHLRRDVPAGSEVEVTLVIDENRLINTSAYIPLLDEEFEAVIDLKIITPVDASQLKADYEEQKKRLNDLQEKVNQSGSDRTRESLSAAQDEQNLRDLDQAIRAAPADADAANLAQSRLLEMKVALDKVEAQVRWPALVAEAEEELGLLNAVLEQFGNEETRRKAKTLESEVRQAIDARSADILRRKIGEVSGLRFKILVAQPEFHVWFFNNLKTEKNKMRNPAQAGALIEEGEAALKAKNYDRLPNLSRQLLALLPEEEQEKQMRKGYGSSLMR
jgi:molecular chaperone DnaK